VSVQFEWRGDLARTQFKGGAADGLREAAQMILEASNAAAPTESTHLVDSSGTDVDAESLEASVYYDPQGAPKGGKPIYAVVRHEALRQGGAPKYLERPFLRNRNTALQMIAGRIRRVL